MFRGRAADLLTEGLPLQNADNFVECPHEDLKNHERVHIDSFGNVQLCQGIGIGNCWKNDLSRIIEEYEPSSHPICGSLYRGGPIKLAEVNNFDISNGFVDHSKK